VKARKRTFDVEYALWDGVDRQPVIDLIHRFCGTEVGPRFSVDEHPDDEYNMVQWYCCEDHELDPGMITVFLVEPEDPDRPGSYWDIMSPPYFHRAFEEVSDAE
jgi:hypothetical protein